MVDLERRLCWTVESLGVAHWLRKVQIVGRRPTANPYFVWQHGVKKDLHDVPADDEVLVQPVANRTWEAQTVPKTD